MSRGRLPALLLAPVLAVLAVLAPATAAVADGTGRISGLELNGSRLSFVFRVDGLAKDVTVDPTSVVVQFRDSTLPSTAKPITTGDDITRAVVLAIDRSRSMAGSKLVAAKAAARDFLATLPADVKVGVVSIGATASTAVPPTTDRALVRSTIDGLALDTPVGTALFDGAAQAAKLTGPEGSRGVVLITDGNEDGSSTTSLDAAVSAATDDKIALDAVFIGNPGAQPPAKLQDLVTGAGGHVTTAGTADLSKVLQESADAITRSLVVAAHLPASAGASGNVVVTATAGTETITASAFASFATKGPAVAAVSHGPIPYRAGGASLGRSALGPLLAALFVGLLVLLALAFNGVKRDDKQGRVRRRLSLYTLSGRAPAKREQTTTALGSSHVARSAVELAGRVVQRRDFESGLAVHLEAAGVPLRAAEWMIIQLGVAIGLALLLLLISGGALFPTMIGLAIGLGAPWAYLLVKESRRTAEFLAQLPDTLQLVAGSLSAGYSMPQAMDTVVREAQQPITGEFNRALVEARLGVTIEDAMDGIARRMQSKDFAWVVMAVRIQREVGGNLAEILTTVATTLRERDRLRRQVKVLSAEGRLSAWILGLLPIAFTLYLAVVRPEYLRPLVTEPVGWLLIGFGVVLLAVGSLWMRAAIKVEV